MRKTSWGTLCGFAVMSIVITNVRGQAIPVIDAFSSSLYPNVLLQHFGIDDGPAVSIKLPLKVFVDGEEWKGHRFGWHLDSGSTMWLAVPGKGRYILSFVPRAGYTFSKAGTVRNNVIMFTAEGDEYEIRLSGPIAGFGKVWNLYVLRQPTWEPKGPLFGVGRLDSLLRLTS